jgi:hypothetical protein
MRPNLATPAISNTSRPPRISFAKTTSASEFRVYEMLKKYVAQAAAVTRCDSVALIFESSERADAILQSEFGIFVSRQGDVQLPVEFCFMPKAAKEPALEVADFVANAVGGMARRMIEGRRDFGADFCSIFHDPPPNVVRYMHIDGVIPASAGLLA